MDQIGPLCKYKNFIATFEILKTILENGINYIDIRWSGELGFLIQLNHMVVYLYWSENVRDTKKSTIFAITHHVVSCAKVVDFCFVFFFLGQKLGRQVGEFLFWIKFRYSTLGAVF